MTGCSLNVQSAPAVKVPNRALPFWLLCAITLRTSEAAITRVQRPKYVFATADGCNHSLAMDGFAAPSQ